MRNTGRKTDRLLWVALLAALLVWGPLLEPIRAQQNPGLTSVDRRLIRYANVTLTNAQVLALNTTPITIVPAMGAGTIIEPLGGVLSFDYTAVYTVGAADDLKLFYSRRETGPAATAAIETTGFLDQTADTVINFGGVPANEIVTVNTAIVLHNTTGIAFGGGNASNTLTVRLAYRVHNR